MMVPYRKQMVESAQSFLGVPFRHHFRPNDLCHGGIITVLPCMENGMDQRGMDCSGLVLASLCQVLEMDPRHWSQDYRHYMQLLSYETPDQPQPGDAVTIAGYDHMGLYLGNGRFAHASNPAQRVMESDLKNPFVAAGRISLLDFLEIAELSA